VWVLISGLRVLSDSWVFRVLICAETAIGFSGGPVLICHGRDAAECKMITNKQFSGDFQVTFDEDYITSHILAGGAGGEQIHVDIEAHLQNGKAMGLDGL